MPTDEESGFRLSDFLSNPWTIGGLALGGGLLSAMHPAAARGVRGAVGLTQLGLGLREQLAEEERKKRVSAYFRGSDDQSVKQPNRRIAELSSAERRARLEEIQKDPRYMGTGKVMSSAEVEERLDPGFTERLRTRLTSRMAGPGSTAQPATPAPASEGFETPPDPTLYKGQSIQNETGEQLQSDGTKWVPVGSLAGTQPSRDPLAQLTEADRKFLAAYADYKPEGALELYGRLRTKEPRAPIVVSPQPGSFSALADPSTGREIARFEGPERPETGGPEVLQLERGLTAMDERGVPKDNVSRLRIEARLKKLTEGQTETQKAIDEARLRELQARTAKLNEALKTARDPNVTTEKLTTELSVALRAQKQAELVGDEEELQRWNTVVRLLGDSLEQRARNRGPGQPGKEFDFVPGKGLVPRK